MHLLEALASCWVVSGSTMGRRLGWPGLAHHFAGKSPLFPFYVCSAPWNSLSRTLPYPGGASLLAAFDSSPQPAGGSSGDIFLQPGNAACVRLHISLNRPLWLRQRPAWFEAAGLGAAEPPGTGAQQGADNSAGGGCCCGILGRRHRQASGQAAAVATCPCHAGVTPPHLSQPGLTPPIGSRG